MQEFINNLANFFSNEITPLVRILIVGLLTIIAILAMKNAIKFLGDSKVKFWKKFFTILICVVFLLFAVFVATC